MSVHLYLAPAACGKTAFLIEQVCEAARDLRAMPRVVTPTHAQARVWRRRIADAGGAFGVRLLTFDRLYAEILDAAGTAYTELSDPVQVRLLRAVVDTTPLEHYASLRTLPGFIATLRDLFGELKAARVEPAKFAQAVVEVGSEPRLVELSQLYTAYQERLQAQGWADRAGLGWLTLVILRKRSFVLNWPLLVVDGFDDFTPVQRELLAALSRRVGEMMVTLTGDPLMIGMPRPVHRRFDATRERLEADLGVKAEPLPQHLFPTPFFGQLEGALFEKNENRPPIEGEGALTLIEAPDRASEVRAALRWLKGRFVDEGLRLTEAALLARSVTPYRSFIQQTAVEFGLPVRFADGLSLRSNPAIAALLDLLRLMLPISVGNPAPALPRRWVVEAWRSPYFDWSGLTPEAIEPGDAEALDAAARRGLVLGGMAQWESALSRLAALDRPGEEHDDEHAFPAGLPVGAAAARLLEKFRAFVARLTPPSGERPVHDFVGWLEALIGPDPAPGAALSVEPEAESLLVVACARNACATADRDVAALQTFKDVLRGLVWAEEAVGAPPIDFSRFVLDLDGAVEGTNYNLPVQPDREELWVADVTQARGLSFRAVAVLGLAEGEFPASLSEDPFLRDDDRKKLRELGLQLEPSTLSAEQEFFYESVTRARERLLFTRPRLADNGAPWEPSPFWEEIRRLTQVVPETLTTESRVAPEIAASWPELWEGLSLDAVRFKIGAAVENDLQTLELAMRALRQRAARARTVRDGDLNELADDWARRFGPARVWSASQLETYRACPFWFFVSRVLGLTPRVEPAEGLDGRQLGNLYHQILEKLFRQAADRRDLPALLAALPEVAGPILAQAPEKEGFRATAWWHQTREEILTDLARSVEALVQLSDDYYPEQFEARFDGPQALLITDGEDCFRMRGIIDRIDRARDGRLRIIDYKSGGAEGYSAAEVRKGRRLQLPLYALAVQEALKLGQPAEGFYWHVKQAKPSGFQLSKFPEAVELAAERAWEAVRGARAGDFTPQPPDDGCPGYCPALAFCWHYRPGFGG